MQLPNTKLCQKMANVMWKWQMAAKYTLEDYSRSGLQALRKPPWSIIIWTGVGSVILNLITISLGNQDLVTCLGLSSASLKTDLFLDGSHMKGSYIGQGSNTVSHLIKTSLILCKQSCSIYRLGASFQYPAARPVRPSTTSWLPVTSSFVKSTFEVCISKPW